ncbi:hypothetical protein Hanom_Chr08g00704341 [Helianthus anomalus]
MCSYQDLDALEDKVIDIEYIGLGSFVNNLTPLIMNCAELILALDYQYTSVNQWP